MAKNMKNVEIVCKTLCKTTCNKIEKNCSKLLKYLFRVDNSAYSLTFPLFPTDFFTILSKSTNSYFSTFTHSLILLLLNN